MPGPIQLVYLINTFQRGGTEIRLAKLARRLAETGRYDVSVCCLVEKGPLESVLADAGISTTVLGYRPLRREGRLLPHRILEPLRSARRLHRWLKLQDVDILHTFLPISNLVGALAARRGGVRHLVASRVSLGRYRDLSPLYAPVENWAARRADRIYCNSRAVFKDVLERERVKKSRLCLIHNGIDVEKFALPVDRAAKRAQLGIPAEGPLVGVVANLSAFKGHETFLRAARGVKEAFPQSRFILVGRDAGQGETLKDLAGELDLTEAVHFLGSRDDVAEIYPILDVLVSASNEEGFSNVLLEGMAARRPIVATRVGGNIEAVENGVTGHLVEVGDAKSMAEKIMILLHDPAERERMGAQGAKRVEDLFTFEKMVAGFDAMYQELKLSS